MPTGAKHPAQGLEALSGQVFATFASLLNLRVYDTQCGAKMFRNTPALRQVFGRQFKVNWTFDVEMLARFSLVQHLPPLGACLPWVEHPLVEWIDVKGSKIGVKDYIQGGIEFCTLFLYLRTPARKGYLRDLAVADHSNQSCTSQQ